MFRFTIRDLLWLMVVVGMGVGWWADRYNRDREWVTTDKYTVSYYDSGTKSSRKMLIEHRERPIAP